MTEKPILVTTDRRGVATVTLNRPEVSNAFNAAMLSALADALYHLGTDRKVRLVVLRGAGKHFSAGADLKAAREEDEELDPMKVLRLIEGLAKPTIALVHGACIGGGVAWAASCDIVIAEEGAFFSIPEVRIGFCPYPMIPLFLRALGARALRRYALTGERFGAGEALRLGFAHALCPAGGLDAAAAPVIDAALHGAPGAIEETKHIIAACLEGSSEAEAHMLDARFADAHESDEAREGVAAFRERRKPSWYTG
jgi:methylglutaconyl-CoA hydratase